MKPLNLPLGVLAVARICHEVNRAYCLALGDTSQKPWDAAPSWQRESAIAGVVFHQFHPHVGPEASHNNWCEDKRKAGWVYGKVKDEDKKTHPCLVLFGELPREQQAKDYIFRAVVHANALED